MKSFKNSEILDIFLTWYEQRQPFYGLTGYFPGSNLFGLEAHTFVHISHSHKFTNSSASVIFLKFAVSSATFQVLEAIQTPQIFKLCSHITPHTLMKLPGKQFHPCDMRHNGSIQVWHNLVCLQSHTQCPSLILMTRYNYITKINYDTSLWYVNNDKYCNQPWHFGWVMKLPQKIFGKR